MNIFRVLSELMSDDNVSARASLDQEFDGYGYMKRVYGIEHMPDVATIAKISITDTLTKAYNRFAFEPFLEEEINKSKRYKYPVTFVILCIDYFKSINYEHGSLVGDFILIELTNLIKNSVRKSDMLFRWNGDEFLIITPHTNLEGTSIMINNIKESISSFNFNTVKNSISCSFGLVEYNYTDSPSKIVQRLENELNKSKSARIKN
jgi:diguanylate cyclase (GGDEF)-like protein